MPALLITILRALVFLILELAAFFFFYYRPDGRKAVYFSWYAGVIDVLAIFSGSLIMFWSIYAMHNPHIFAVDVPDWVFWLGFLVGSWQAGIHLVKIVIRFFAREREDKQQ